MSVRYACRGTLATNCVPELGPCNLYSLRALLGGLFSSGDLARLETTSERMLRLLPPERRSAVPPRGNRIPNREEIESQIKRARELPTSVEMPLSAESRRILNLAAEESERLGQKGTGTKHLPLGILRESGCWAARLWGLTLDWLRPSILRRKQPRRLFPCGKSRTQGGMAKRLTQKPEGWTIARVQSSGLEPQSRSAAG
jgi:hypothetical protein